MKDHSISKWIFWLVLGTIAPAFGGLALMKTDWFELPAESWEFMATSCTMAYFFLFHIIETTMGSRRRLEALLDTVTIISMTVLGLFWLCLIHPPDWVCFPFTPEQRLHYRCYCGVGMFAIILVMNTILWLFWWRRKRATSNTDSKTADLYIRYNLSLCLLDMPTLFSLVVVLTGCHFILTTLPDAVLANVPSGLAPATAELSPEMIRLKIASTFYSGAAAFHMMLGNAVFSFVHSGRILSVLADHSKFRPPQGANP